MLGGHLGWNVGSYSVRLGYAQLAMEPTTYLYLHVPTYHITLTCVVCGWPITPGTWTEVGGTKPDSEQSQVSG